MSKIYEQLCTAIKNKIDAEIETALNLLENEKDPNEIVKFKILLRTNFNDYLLGLKMKPEDESRLKLKLQELGFNVPQGKRLRDNEDANPRPKKRAQHNDTAKPHYQFTSGTTDFFVAGNKAGDKQTNSKSNITEKPRQLMQINRNFFTPEPVAAIKSSLFTYFEPPKPPKKRPAAGKRQSDLSFSEQLELIIDNPKRLKKMTLHSISLTEIEERIKQCVDLVSKSSLKFEEKQNIYSLLLNKAYNLYLDHVTRVENEPEQFPLLMNLGILYKNLKHSHITSLFTKLSFDAYMKLVDIYHVFTKYYKDMDLYRTMEHMNSQSILYIANPETLAFLDAEFKIAPYDLKQLLLNAHVEERINELYQERKKNPMSKTIYEVILSKSHQQCVTNPTIQTGKEYNSLPINDSYVPDNSNQYSPMDVQSNHSVIHYHQPVHIHHNFMMAPSYNLQAEPTSQSQQAQVWTNYSAAIIYPQAPPQSQQLNTPTQPNQEKQQPNRQGFFQSTADNQEKVAHGNKNNEKIRISDLLNT